MELRRILFKHLLPPDSWITQDLLKVHNVFSIRHTLHRKSRKLLISSLEIYFLFTYVCITPLSR